MQLLGTLTRIVVGALVLAMLIPNTWSLARSGISLLSGPGAEPSRSIGYFLGALMLELVLILVLKRFVLRRSPGAHRAAQPARPRE
jgi:hypothetical protein